jgi:hypothetical protein
MCRPEIANEHKRKAAEPALAYMGLAGGEKLTEIGLNRVFIGSCTNGRIEDLREVARVVNGKMVNPNVYAMIVPGSGLVKEQAEAEGLDEIFVKAGFRVREPGCSMCLAMNSGQAQARRALRVDLEPQLRGTSGLQGPHASGVARDGGGRRHRWPLCRRARVALSLRFKEKSSRSSNARTRSGDASRSDGRDTSRNVCHDTGPSLRLGQVGRARRWHSPMRSRVA